MSDFQISDSILTKECDQIAAVIYAEVMADHEGENPDDYRDEMSDRARAAADGHQWVIYTYTAIQLCANCDINEGEEFLKYVGMPSEVTFGSLATAIAYGEMRARIVAEISELIGAWESPDDEA